jgi:hypothetical protein
MHQALCEIDALTGVATVVQCRGCHFVWHSRRAIQGVALVHIACNLFAHPSAMLQFPTRRERGVGCKAVQAVVLLAQTQARSTRSFVGAGMCLRATYPKHLTHTHTYINTHTDLPSMLRHQYFTVHTHVPFAEAIESLEQLPYQSVCIELANR